MARIWFIAHYPSLKNAMDDDIYYSYAEAKELCDDYVKCRGFENLKVFSAVVAVDEETVTE